MVGNGAEGASESERNNGGVLTDVCGESPESRTFICP